MADRRRAEHRRTRRTEALSGRANRYALRKIAQITGKSRSQQLRRVPHHRLPSMLEYRERLGDFGNRLFRALRIDDDDVRRAADGKAIVAKIE